MVHTLHGHHTDLLYAEMSYLPDVMNDFDVDFTADPKAAEAYTHDQRNRRKIKEHTEKLNLNIITPLREGKRLLVLDIDYSTFARVMHRKLLMIVSHSRYQAFDVRVAPARGMRAARAP